MKSRWSFAIAWAAVLVLSINAIRSCDPPRPPKSATEEAAFWESRRAPYRPECEALYDEELVRMDALARSLPADNIPLNPSYAELRTLLGPEDARPSNRADKVVSHRLGWRATLSASRRDNMKRHMVDRCADEKDTASFAQELWGRTFSPAGALEFVVEVEYPVIALIDGGSSVGLGVNDDSRPAGLLIRPPFRGTIAGFRLGEDVQTFRNRAIESGWKLLDPTQGQVPISPNTIQQGRFRLSPEVANGRVVSIYICDTQYRVTTVN